MSNKMFNSIRARRAEAINDLNYTYRRLLRLLPALFRRAPEPRLAGVLKEQSALDADSSRRLTTVAMDLGQPPGPCLCAEAEHLVSNVYVADRVGATPAARTWGIVRALKAVRVHLIRMWTRLIDELGEDQSAARKEAAALQQVDAAQHRQLAKLTNQLEEPQSQAHPTDGKRRSA